ncbi:MAG: RibD family protein [Hyphomicrobiaceae bacterium]
MAGLNVQQPTQASDPIAVIENAPADRPFVVAQLGQSLDGRIATNSGESRWINGEAALDHVHRIRAAVDAVVVGIGTAIADDPILNVRRVPGRNPARVVIDPSGRLPATARCLAEDGARRLVVRACDMAPPPGVELVRVPSPGGRMNPHDIVAALAKAGLRTMLIEGGAQTVSWFLESGALNRLHVLVAPVILGSGKPGLSTTPIERLAQALRPKATIHVLATGDVLFDCDLSNTHEGD